MHDGQGTAARNALYAGWQYIKSTSRGAPRLRPWAAREWWGRWGNTAAAHELGRTHSLDKEQPVSEWGMHKWQGAKVAI